MCFADLYLNNKQVRRGRSIRSDSLPGITRGIGWSLRFDLWICVCEAIYIYAWFFTVVSILRRPRIEQGSTIVQFNAITGVRH
jgi:hypothetical protein